MTFVVEDDEISHVYVGSVDGEFNIELEKVRPHTISEIIEAMNGVTFTANVMGKTENIFAEGDNIVDIWDESQTYTLTDECHIEYNVNDFYSVEYNTITYAFFLSNGKVIYMAVYDAFESHIFTAAGTAATLADVIEVMGDKKYIEEDDYYLKANGSVIDYRDCEDDRIYKTIDETTSVTKVGNNYYCVNEDQTIGFIVEVVDGKVTQIDINDDGDAYIAIPSSQTPTDINDVDIVKPTLNKAIKSVENGKIVIIKNGVTYDLSGRKVE